MNESRKFHSQFEICTAQHSLVWYANSTSSFRLSFASCKEQEQDKKKLIQIDNNLNTNACYHSNIKIFTWIHHPTVMCALSLLQNFRYGLSSSIIIICTWKSTNFNTQGIQREREKKWSKYLRLCGFTGLQVSLVIKCMLFSLSLCLLFSFFDCTSFEWIEYLVLFTYIRLTTNWKHAWTWTMYVNLIWFTFKRTMEQFIMCSVCSVNEIMDMRSSFF